MTTRSSLLSFLVRNLLALALWLASTEGYINKKMPLKRCDLWLVTSIFLPGFLRTAVGASVASGVAGGVATGAATGVTGGGAAGAAGAAGGGALFALITQAK